MLECAEFSFIPKLVHKETQEKWSKRWVDLHVPLHGAGYCLESLEPEFHDHSTCPEALADLLGM